MGSFNFGSFAGGLAEGLSRGQELKLRANESKLKAKMLEHQLKTQEFDQQKRIRESQEQAQQQIELGRYVDMATKGVQEELQPGFEDPNASMSRAPVMGGFRPANPQELLGQGLKSVPAANRASLIGQSLKPQAAMTRPVKPGDYVPDPTDPSGYRQIGTPSKAGEERSLTIGEIQRLYPELPPDRAQVVATLPAKAQERTLDNVRAQSGQEQSASQFREGQNRLQQQFQQGQTLADEREQRRERDQLKRQETGLRSEHQKQSKKFITQRNNLAELEATSTGGAVADHSLIFKYLKVLDPTSTVREGEFATVRDTTGLPDRVKNYLKQVWSGTKLNPKQRKEIIEQSRAQFGVAQAHQQRLDEEYRRLSAGQGLDPNRVVLDYSTPASTQSKVGGVPVGTIKKLGGKTFRKTGPGELDWDVVQ